MWRYAAWDGRIKWAVTGILAVLIVVAAVSGAVGGGEDGDDARSVVADTVTEPPRTEQSSAAATKQPTQVPTQTLVPPPTATLPPSWEDGAPTNEESVRAALEDADEMIRSENLGRPTRVVANLGTVTVEYKADSIFGETDLLTVAAQTTYSALRALFMNPQVESVSVNIVADWTDQYGRTTEEPTTSVFLAREFVDSRIDWDGLRDLVYADNKHIFCIVELAEDYYIHPAIYVRLEDKGFLIR